MNEELTTELDQKTRKRASNPNRGAKKGERRGGRQKGTPNKTTKAIKEALVEAFDLLGGVESLVAWGRDNQTEFYKLWVKILPMQLEHSGDVGFSLNVVDDTDE